MKVLLAGSSGMLGSTFAAALGRNCNILQRGDLTGGGLELNLRAMKSAGFEALINCAAYTNVEQAEREPDADQSANVTLPASLAAACFNVGLKLVHFSSTGCYGDWKPDAYVETDPAHPTTTHHRHKLEGEQRIVESGAPYLIIRTGWLYGGEPASAKNFVWNRLVEAKRGTRMTSDSVQRGCPTSVNDVVSQTLALMDAAQEGLFNVVAQGFASRFEYVRFVVEAAALPCEVIPGPAYKRLASVSANETAVNRRLQAMGMDTMPDWKTSLGRYLEWLLSTKAWSSLP